MKLAEIIKHIFIRRYRDRLILREIIKSNEDLLKGLCASPKGEEKQK